MTTYHARMKLIQCNTTGYGTKAERLACADGHAVARHACAEIANEADAEVERMRAALKAMADEFVKVFPVYYYAEPWAHDRNEALKIARAALGEKP